jgi:Arc/MetJ-type ribon-helix-helix transcriptional regulator
MRARDDQPPTVITSFQLPLSLLERVRAVARRRDVSMANAVRAGLRLWLATQDDAGERR